MNRPRIVIAGVHSGAGKTTVTIGLMAALQRRGMAVQGFKVGPDYIDPSYHSAITKTPSRNIDTWMMSPDVAKEIFQRASEDKDISIIEGVMGMYDGKDALSNHGSTAEMAVLTESPVILVVDAERVARSAAAMVLGFQQMDPSVKIAGVIVNYVGGEGHYQLVRAAIEQVCHIPVLGYLTRSDTVGVPERHLGLIPAIERGELEELFAALADGIEKTIDVNQVIQLAQSHARWSPVESTLFKGAPKKSEVTIAVARDSAFNFYYPENFELLEWSGAQICYFQPLEGETVPADADGLYIGGGFPEEFAEQLSRQESVIRSVQSAVANNMPVFAECGGFMFLTNEIRDKDMKASTMVGVIPAVISMQKNLAAIGYREVEAVSDNLLLQKGETARGHEFHYSTSQLEDERWPYAYRVESMFGQSIEGFAKNNVLAGYTHLHFASNPNMAKRFVAACNAYRQKREVQ